MENISVFALKEAQSCKKAEIFSNLHLNYHEGRKSKTAITKKAISVMLQSFAEKKGLDDALVLAKEQLNEYPVNPEELAAAAEQEKAKVFARIEAMGNFLWAQPGEPKVNVPVSFTVDGVVFADKADLVLKTEEGTRAIMFETGENPFSQKARNLNNKPDKNIPGAFVCAAGYQACEVWYLKSKDEKGDCVPQFEIKPEKNICQTQVSADDAKAYLKEIISNTVCGDCQNCRHSAVCNLAPIRNNSEETGSGRSNPVFTPEQELAVNHRDGALALLAVPGAGKTTVLVHRLLKLLQSGVKASEILFVTFTKKAASEIRERVEALLPAEAEIPEISTFNALGYNILKENPMLVGKRIKVADDNDSKMLIHAILDDFAKEGRTLAGMSYSGAFLKFGIVSRLTGWFREIAEKGKEAFIEARGAKVSDLDGVLSMYDEYERRFKALGYITFDEQVSLVNGVFSKYPRVVAAYGERYHYIMVDEFQDASEEQAKMIYAIAKTHNNIVVVGDEDQSIYGWRGGSSRFLRNFKEDFPSAEMVVMSDNFRSNDKILAAANAVIQLNAGKRVEKEIRGHKDAKNSPILFLDSGAEKIAEVIPQLLKSYQPGDIAVLARTNARLEEVEKVLSPVVKVSAPKDYMISDAVFQIIYDVITLYYNTGNDVALYRVLTRLGVTDIPQKESADVSLYDAICSAVPGFNLDRLDVNAMTAYAECSTEIMKAGKTILMVLKKLQYYRSMESAFVSIAEAFDIPSDHKVIENLLDTCDEHAFVKISDLYAYMRDMVLYGSTKRVGYDAEPDAVALLTAHDSKGKEFPVVILFGTEDFADGSEENNCLLYVAMTRAKNTLVMIEGLSQNSVLTLGELSDYLNVR